MKKWMYLVSGVVIGAVLATSGSALAAQVKSLVGQKVTSELTVVVNGKVLSDKGAVINNKTNVPVRALADAMGADIMVDGKTVKVTTGTPSQDEPLAAASPATPSTNKYIGLSKASIEDSLDVLKNQILRINETARDGVLKEIEQAKKAEAPELLSSKQKQLAEIEAKISETKADIAQAEAALAQLK
ncbi:copper amine oxidase [Paenibacillus sp. CAA11]|uniref:stalk domain-containing protein n=1 Tax=Paenibacillus sp. CAA11 TaxID=1532905 RepID=UPI000D3C0268|nr:stalk domain-containing protein [Paenibacillus sp. CAA11]AWB45264.1 copper amine oxidase [Paenibacillus sp. CAA11]